MNIMTESEHLNVEVQAAIAVFLRNYVRGSGPFAISEAINAVRRVYPSLELSDNDLTDAIAAAGVAGGLTIHFDGVGRSTPKPAAERWENEGGAISS